MKFGRARTQQDGSIVYPKKGWEPPPPIGGFTRDPSNKWRFIPIWPKCVHRVQLMTVKPCGAVDVLMMCQNEACPKSRKSVKLRECQDCEFRQPEYVQIQPAGE